MTYLRNLYRFVWSSCRNVDSLVTLAPTPGFLMCVLADSHRVICKNLKCRISTVSKYLLTHDDKASTYQYFLPSATPKLFALLSKNPRGKFSGVKTRVNLYSLPCQFLALGEHLNIWIGLYKTCWRLHKLCCHKLSPIFTFMPVDSWGNIGLPFFENSFFCLFGYVWLILKLTCHMMIP